MGWQQKGCVPLPFVQCLYVKARLHHYNVIKGRYAISLFPKSEERTQKQCPPHDVEEQSTLHVDLLNIAKITKIYTHCNYFTILLTLFHSSSSICQGFVVYITLNGILLVGHGGFGYLFCISLFAV